MSALTRLRRTAAALLLGVLATFAGLAEAEQMISDGRYEIHYNAFNSSFLEPEVAQRYGLTRSQYRALINVSVLKIGADGSKTPARAVVKGQAANLLQQAQTLEFQQIDEGTAIYYIGGFRFTEEEKLKIDLQVQPDPNTQPYAIEFEQTFYVN